MKINKTNFKILKLKNKLVMGMLLLLIVVLFVGCSAKTNSPSGNVVSDSVRLTGEVKEFNIEAFQYGFDPEIIEVNLGDTVKITASSRDVPHGLAIFEFGVSLYLDGLQSDSVEFVADQKGEFTYYCSVPCGSGHGAMKGKLIVK